MSTFSFIKPQNGLWKDAKIAKVHARILERITNLPHEIRENKHNMELVSLVCNMIENSGISNSDKTDKLKIDKKVLLIQIYKSLYGQLLPQDIDTLDKNVEFLHDNGHIIKHAAWKLCAYSVVEWFKRKVLWKLREWVVGYVQDYLVDKFFELIKTPKVVKALLTMDALYFIQLFLMKYGLSKFLNYVLWVGLFI